MTFDLPRPFRMEGVVRVDDTPQHKAVREAFTNSVLCKHLHKKCYVKSHIMSSSAINYKNCYWESKRCA